MCIFGVNELLGLEFGQADANSAQKVFPILNSQLQYCDVSSVAFFPNGIET